jgi:segregation and condensation protein A
MAQSSAEIFEIKLPLFEGPFDLLLFFIQKDELDIYDIPISKVTADFLDYLHHLKQMNMDIASEFILVAATLMKIKANMLLPRQIKDENGDIIDPREELVQKLVEYKQYKEICQLLSEMEDARLRQVSRGNVGEELQKISKLYETDLEMESLTIDRLYKVFEQLMKKKANRAEEIKHTVDHVPYTIAEQKNSIIQLMNKRKNINFEELFVEIHVRIHALFHFLAVLELVQEGFFKMVVGEGINNFYLEKNNNSIE